MIGQCGQLARALDEELPGLTKLCRPGFDLTSPMDAERRVRNEGPDLVINAAAYTDVDGAEEEAEAAYAVNCAGIGAVARGAAAAGAALIHISTDYVFDGQGQGAWAESDLPRPLNVYGASKLAGEQEALSANVRTLILRTSWLYAPWERNFVTTMLGLGEREQVAVVADQYSKPTSALSLARAIRALVPMLSAAPETAPVWGIRHYAGRGVTSWADFAREIFAMAEGNLLERSPGVVSIATADYPTRALRPTNSALDCTAFERDFGIEMVDWRQALREVIDRIKMDETAT